MTKDLFSYADDNHRISLVYQALNRVNGKRYVGLTRLTLDKRRKTHFVNARRRHGHHQQYFYQAIRKYGEDAFEFSVLSRHDTYKAACAAERSLIAQLRPEYNLTAGGEGVVGHRHDAATRRQMSARKNGKGPWAKGQCPPEVRAKLSLAAQRRKGRELITGRRREAIIANARRGNDARRQPVICLDDGFAYPSASTAAAHYGISRAGVQLLCRTGRSGERGLRFVFVDEVWQQ
jgi:group I intron endonuclease